MGNGARDLFTRSGTGNDQYLDLEAGGEAEMQGGPGSLYANTLGQFFQGGAPGNGYMPVGNHNGNSGGTGFGGFADKIASAGSNIRGSIESMAPPSAEQLQWFGILLACGLLCLTFS